MEITIIQALGYSLLGFSIVFAALIALWGVIGIIAKFFAAKEAKAKAKAPAAAPAAAAPAAPVVTGSGEMVAAPMPGTILKVNVKNGDAVKEGQVLVVLEAMKMENEIMAPKSGTITQVAVQKGASVNTGDALVFIG